MSQAALAIYNAKIFTANDQLPFAEAVAVNGNQIIYVGSDEGLRPYLAPDTQVIDGLGRSVIPGIIDAHFHFEWGSQTLVGAQLYGLKTLAELQKAFEAWMVENPDLPWVLGQGCSYAIPSDHEPLTRVYLDQIESEKPLAVTTFDMHSMFVNTAALKAAGLWDDPPDELANGSVVLGEDGRPTGELYEMDAMNYVRRAFPKPTVADRIQTIQKGLALLARHGITSVHNMDGDLRQGEIYAMMEDRGLLTARVHLPFWVKPEMELSTMLDQATAMRDRFSTELLRSSGVKFFMDGVYESYTAVTLNGYPDQPQNLGEPIWPAERFAEFAAAADREGLQIAVHACGNGAVRRVLDGLEAAQKKNGRRDSRHRIEHIEMVDPADVTRFADLDVLASMQPLHAPLEENDPDVWTTRVFREEWDWAFPWRSLREAGIRLVFGSDWPVVTLDPLLGIWGAVNRRPLAQDVKNHRQTLTEAILSYTRDAAYAEFQEEKKGRIKVGMWADLVLLSDDIFALPAERLNEVRVERTVCNGRMVYQR